MNELVKVKGRSAAVVAIVPARGWVSLGLHEMWNYRELLYFLIWRDVKVRYKQTALGALWAVLQPLLTMLVFSLFFGRLAKVPSDGIPYPVFAFAALVPWTFFSTGVTQGANSLVGSANLIKKVYFPRLTVPLGAVLAGIVDLGFALLVLCALMLYYGISPSANVVWIPLFVVLALVTSLGAGLWLSAFNVRFRDVRYVLPFLIQFWMFATPIAYSSSLLPESWRTVYGLNPMVGVVDGFRWALLDSSNSPGPQLLTSSATALLMLVSGAYYFRSTESSFADIL